MKKIISLLMCTTVLTSSIALTPCFAEETGIEVLTSLGETSNEGQLTSAGWKYINYAKADSDNTLKFVGGGMSMTYGDAEGHKIDGIADDKSLTVSMNIRQNVAQRSFFSVKFTDVSGNSVYVSFTQLNNDTTKDVYISDTAYSTFNAVGNVDLIDQTYSNTVSIRLKAATNTIDILNENTELVKNIAISATPEYFFDASKLKTITLASKEGDASRITTVKNIKITKEPNSETRPSLATASEETDYVQNTFEGLGANQLPAGFSNVSFRQSKAVGFEQLDDAHGISMKITQCEIDSGACLVFDRLIKSGEVIVEWDEYVADANSKPKMYISSKTDGSFYENGSKVLNSIGTGGYDSNLLKTGKWTHVIYKINFAGKHIRFQYGDDTNVIHAMSADNTILTDGLKMLMFVNNDSTPVYYDNLKITRRECTVTSIDKSDINNGNVKIGYTNNTTTVETDKVIAACFDNEERFISCDVKDVSFMHSTTSTADITFSNMPAVYSRIEVFLWNDLEDLKPLLQQEQSAAAAVRSAEAAKTRYYPKDHYIQNTAQANYQTVLITQGDGSDITADTIVYASEETPNLSDEKKFLLKSNLTDGIYTIKFGGIDVRAAKATFAIGVGIEGYDTEIPCLETTEASDGGYNWSFVTSEGIPLKNNDKILAKINNEIKAISVGEVTNIEGEGSVKLGVQIQNIDVNAEDSVKVYYRQGGSVQTTAAVNE